MRASTQEFAWIWSCTCVNKHPLSTWSQKYPTFLRSSRKHVLFCQVNETVDHKCWSEWFWDSFCMYHLLLQNENNPHTNDLLLEWLQLLQQEAMMCLLTLSKISQNCLNVLIKKRKSNLAALECCSNWHKLHGNLWVCWGWVKGAGGEIGVLAVCI